MAEGHIDSYLGFNVPGIRTTAEGPNAKPANFLVCGLEHGNDGQVLSPFSA